NGEASAIGRQDIAAALEKKKTVCRIFLSTRPSRAFNVLLWVLNKATPVLEPSLHAPTVVTPDAILYCDPEWVASDRAGGLKILNPAHRLPSRENPAARKDSSDPFPL